MNRRELGAATPRAKLSNHCDVASTAITPFLIIKNPYRESSAAVNR
jgi:hypothetical protein